MYTVYQHMNLRNGKSYIGMTSQNPKKRWENGLSGYRNNQQMYNDIKNSDWNTDWKHSIIRQFKDKDEALKYEAFLIAMLGTVRNGYNTSAYASHSCKHSEESKRKMSEANKGKVYAPIKAVLQFSKDGKLIAEYSSIHEAERQTGCKNQNICNCCRGERKSTGGYIWKYKEI